MFGSVVADKFFRFFGDWNGDRSVNNTDFTHFAQTMNKSTGDAGFLWYMDYTSNGAVNNSDFTQFANRMNKSMAFQ